MKTRILVLGLFIFSLIVTTALMNQNNVAKAESINKFICVTVTLTGSGNTNATVWIVNTSTGAIQYIPHIGGGVYQKQHGVDNGTYNVFACSNSPTYGSEYNQVLQTGISPIVTTIALQGGECPFGA